MKKPGPAAAAPVHLTSAALRHVPGGDGEPSTSTTVSNVLKTRHDTVKNTISNVR